MTMTETNGKMFPVTVISTKQAFGQTEKPDLSAVIERRRENGYALIGISPAAMMDSKYEEVREKLLRELSDVQRQAFAYLENRSGIMMVWKRLEMPMTSAPAEPTVAEPAKEEPVQALPTPDVIIPPAPAAQ
jgi:hypothetical protein